MTSIFYKTLILLRKILTKNSTYCRMRFWPLPGRPGPAWAPWPGPSPRSTASTRSSKRQRRRKATASATEKTTESHSDDDGKDDGKPQRRRRRQQKARSKLTACYSYLFMCRKYKHVTYDVWFFSYSALYKGAAGYSLCRGSKTNFIKVFGLFFLYI